MKVAFTLLTYRPDHPADIEYTALDVPVTQHVPDKVKDTRERLLAAGYDSRLLTS